MADDKKEKKIIFGAGEIDASILEANNLMKNEGEGALTFAIKNAMGTAKKSSAPRIGFSEDPNSVDHYMGVYKSKKKLLPDSVIKLIRVQNHLVASVLRARANTMSMFGHLKKDRFDVGIEVSIRPEYEEHVTPEQMVKIKDRIEKFKKILINCGHTDGLEEDERMSLSDFFYLQTMDGISLGRFATEIIYEENDNGDPDDPKDRAHKFNRFRPVDAGTIYKTVKKGESAQSLRQSGLRLLEQVTGKKINIESFDKDEYAYVQAIESMPKQAFAADELIVHNLYPSNDIDHNGYPVTPIDTCISSITTHLSIDAYNKLYFQNGRAAKGILVIKSEELDQNTLNQLKQDFMASINNVGNSFRVPVFGVGKEDEVGWTPMVSSAGDGEFQFLYDAVARNILSTFSMSPDELPGYGHLSRGTNQQTLCLDLNTKILTKSGNLTLSEILSDEEEVYTEVWTGVKWEKAKIFYSGLRRRIKTKLNNGMEIITSPEHRFKVIGENGEPEWKTQKELNQDTWVLVNRKNASGNKALPEYKGKPLTNEMAEVLGWLTGDGNISVRHNKNTGNIKQASLSWFYNADKEKDLWSKHAQILENFGLKVKNKEIQLNEKQVEKRKDSCFAKTANSTRLINFLYDTDFVKFLFSIGFTDSAVGKSIPAFLSSAPEDFKGAFLRGFFSADGTLAKNSSPKIVIHDDNLRQQTKELLLSMGIRTNLSEGKYKNHPNRKLNKTEAKTNLRIKDKTMFFEKIGFLQDHKQPDYADLTGFKRWEKTSFEVCKKYIPFILENGKEKLSGSDRNNLLTVLNPESERTISSDRLIQYMKQVKLEVPSWMEDFHLEKIVSITDMGEMVEMGDVEIFDNEHAFIANGMVVHNSESSNEFKLSAARDTGLRPLVLQFQSFLNEKMFHIMDPELAQLCTIKLSGLDAQSREQETVRLQQQMPIHMDYDQVMVDVDKKPVGERMAGKIPFNEHYQIIADKYINVSDIIAEFMKSPAALADPLLKYKRDPFFIQNMQVLMQVNPAAIKAYYSTKPYAIEILKMMIQDYLEEDSEKKQ